jgi:Tfp pilus assembly protein PilV
MKRVLCNQKGVTLIEVLIAEALMGIVVIALLVVLANAYRFNSFTDARETAKNFAEYEMQYLKSSRIGFNSVLTGTNGSTTYTLASQPAVFNSYNATITQVRTLQTNEQLITVTITGPGVTYSLSGYKVTY